MYDGTMATHLEDVRADHGVQVRLHVVERQVDVLRYTYIYIYIYIYISFNIRWSRKYI